jgi:hypothetical protein
MREVENFKDPEALRAYIRNILEDKKSNHSMSHPSILNGESVDKVIKDTEKYKKAFERAG